MSSFFLFFLPTDLDELVKSPKKADLSLRPARHMAGGAKRGNLISL